MKVGIAQGRYFVAWTVLYSVLVVLFMAIAAKRDGAWVFDGADGVVVALVVLMRFIDGYLSPLIYQKVALQYPNKAHEMNQWISATAAIAAFVGVWITYFFVQ